MTIARIRSIGIAIAIAAALIALGGSPARAQSAEAETLFREGKRLMKEGDYAAACEKLEASDRLEPSAGTKLNLADCREKNGQLASAWSTFLKAASAAKRADKDGKREAEAKRRAAALEPRLIYLTVLIPDDNRLEGLAIKRNDTALDEELWNERVPVDPGTYTITVEAPGYESWTEDVSLTTKSKSIDVPHLKRSSAEPAGGGTKGRGATDDAERARAPEAPSSFTGLRKLSVAMVVIGAAAIGGGAYLGMRSQADARDADEICPAVMCASAEAVDLNESARRNAKLANIAYIGGGAVVAGAVVLWFVGAPSPRKERMALTPTVSADQVGLSLGGVF